MRRARAYSSFCSQVVLFYVHLFRCSSLLCSRKSQKITKNSYFGGSRLLKVIDVDTTKKHVSAWLTAVSGQHKLFFHWL